MINQLENLSDYILKTKEEREAHIDLDAPCDLRRSSHWNSRRKSRRELLEQLGVVRDVNMKEAKIDLRHLCSCGTTHGKKTGLICVNPQHIAVGTCSENTRDIPAEVIEESLKAAREALWSAATPEQRRELTMVACKAMNTARSRATEVINIQTGDVYWFPSTAEAARELGLSPTALRAVATGRRKKHKGFTASYIEGPNPFY